MRFVSQPGRGSRFRAVVLPTLFVMAIAVQRSAGDQQGRRSFTVADDIALTEMDSTVMFSPNATYFFITSHRGRLDINQIESSIRIYSVASVVAFLSTHDATAEIAPLWTISKTCQSGPVISSARWLADSSGVAFLAKTEAGNDRLFLARLRLRVVEALTPIDQHVTGFDVQSALRFVYTVLSPDIRVETIEERQNMALAGTGRSLVNLLFPEDATKPDVWLHDLSELWAVIDGKRLRVVDQSTHRPVPVHLFGQRALALRPDGHSVVTALTIPVVPTDWETLYPPRSPSSAYRVRARRQDPYALRGQYDASEYSVVDLRTGKATSLTGAPIGSGWGGHVHADWSGDGGAVVLAYTFLPPGKQRSLGDQINRPCVAVADLVKGRVNCVDVVGDAVQRANQPIWKVVVDARFAESRNDLVAVTYQDDDDDETTRSRVCFSREGDGAWSHEGDSCTSTGIRRRVRISIRQDMNTPPFLIATDNRSGNSRVLWDANPDLNRVHLGDVSVLKWRDSAGRTWEGGLYKPPNYASGTRYPLVIQTHGFSEHTFLPSGSYPTVFAAQELAAAGILVLQIVEDCPGGNGTDGPCQVAGYEAAVEHLAAEGLIDSDRVGIAGYSHTCYHVLEALTSGTLHFKAALIADGINLGYLEYILAADLDGQNSYAHFADAIIGSPPFGLSLSKWLERSPVFNMDKVNSPLEVVATRGGLEALQVWEPYAALRYLHKPVDLVVLNSEEHPVTNPRARHVSQGTAIDWFRFWLEDYEDRDPKKTSQYARWRALR